MKQKTAYIQKEQRRIVDLVTKKFKHFYLTGGTALAFYFHHRFSEDLDFFSQKYTDRDPAKIMNFISKETGFRFYLESKQDDPKLLPMTIYFLELKKACVLKIDFVRDFTENIKKIRGGMHSIEDIYFRKISAATGTGTKEDLTGHLLPTGRQTAKDLFDIYFLSSNFMPLADFIFEYFAYDQIELLDTWYKIFDRTELKLELVDMIPGVNVRKVLSHLDKQILNQISAKLREG